MLNYHLDVRRIKKRRKNKYRRKADESIYRHEIILSGHDRIKYSYRKVGNKYVEVINSSYETFINTGWVTLVRFDSAHGYLHRHSRLSLTDTEEYITKEPISDRGSHHEWLTWTLRDLTSNFYDYRTSFFERNKLINNYD